MSRHLKGLRRRPDIDRWDWNDKDRPVATSKKIEASRGELDALGLLEIDIRLGEH
jgi:hypothetical protein